MEVFRNIEAQMEKAVQLGEDALILSLDRAINPILEDILGYRAVSGEDLKRQLSFIADLLARRSDDAATVARLAAKISEITASYFQDAQQRLRDIAASDVITAPVLPAPAPALPVGGHCPPIARVAVVSMEYRLLYCNAIMAEGLHVPAKELVGKPLTEFCNRDLFEQAYRTHIELCLAGDFREFEAPWLGARDESVRVRLTPLRDFERRIVGAVFVAQVKDQMPLEH